MNSLKAKKLMRAKKITETIGDVRMAVEKIAIMNHQLFTLSASSLWVLLSSLRLRMKTMTLASIRTAITPRMLAWTGLDREKLGMGCAF